ncbi:alpha/beta-hydrolase [Trichoderma barbatum]
MATDRAGSVAAFFHGNPTSSYLWRNIFPHVAKNSRCIVPVLISFSDSDRVDGLEYIVRDHQRYICISRCRHAYGTHHFRYSRLGSALGLDRASRHEDRVAGIAFIDIFNKFRTPELGRTMIIEQSLFVELILPSGVLRGLTEEEMEVGEKVKKYTAWFLASELPKLFLWVKPGTFIMEHDVEKLSGEMKNSKTLFLGEGSHFMQEDHPHSIGQEIAGWMAELSL